MKHFNFSIILFSFEGGLQNIIFWRLEIGLNQFCKELKFSKETLLTESDDLQK